MIDASFERSLRYLNSGGRRFVDASLALLALVVLGPVLLGVALLVRLVDGAPVLFRQERIGRDGQRFALLKFRTMRVAGDPVADLLDGGARVTRLGELLRRTSIDELPALLNILRGDMSIVGPRPLLPVHVPLYAESHPERLLVRPGLTGLAQVMGRKQLTFRQRLDLDVEFIRTASPRGDVGVVLRTVVTVLRSISSPSEGAISEVDDIGLADAIRSAARGTTREHGSFLQPHAPVGRESAPSLRTEVPGVLFGTARQAFVALARTATRIHVPSYFCPDVVDALRSSLAAEIVRYPDHPLASDSTVVTGEEDLVVVLPHFGRPTRVSVAGGRLLIDATQTLGLDRPGLTSDAAGRPADLCVASLRKTLPVPDGALVWSPTGVRLPEVPALGNGHESAARRLLAALDAKVMLLRGERSDKPEVLREIVAAVEALEASSEPSAALPETAERLQGFDLAARWDAREANREAAVARLRQLGVLGEGRLELLEAPFMLVLLAVTHAERERLRAGLIARDVYPAVLWPHDHCALGSPDRDLGERMLAIHVDARYSPSDLEQVADHVHAVHSEAGHGR
jgi:lipopolysaccharide/colanic/teichoic acid biosynthesis glycosyltransferase